MTQSEESREPRVGLNYVFIIMNEDYRKEVVRKTLQAEKQLAGDVVRTLQQAVQGIPAQGHRPGNGPLRLYQRPLSMAVCVDRDIAGAMLRGWIRLHEALRDSALDHYRGRVMLDGAADLDADDIDITHWSDAHHEAMELLVEQETTHSRDDVILMSYLVCGAMPGPEGDIDAEETPGMAETPPLFRRMLGALHGLPLDGEEWTFAERGLLAALRELRENREAEGSRAEAAQAAADTVASVTARHREAMAFLEIEGARIAPPDVGWANLEEAQRLLERLETLLSEYDAVREQAPVRSEDLVRRSTREALEPQIDETLTAIDALETAAPLRASQWADVDDGTLSAAALRDDIDALCSSLAESEGQRNAAAQERDALAAERAALTAERDALREDVAGLELDFDQSRDNEENFRQLYLAYVSHDADAPQPEAPNAESVSHAVQMAEERWTGQLEFKLNTKSDLDTPFDKPQQVYDALEWLATDYFRSKTGEESEPDLIGSLKRSCGWKYTPFQSETTMGMYPEYYETTINGRKRKLEEHIGTGNGYHRGTIRIAFLWDAGQKRVVIGYIGRHQRTRAT